MKTLGRAFKHFFITSSFLMFGIAGYNSYRFNKPIAPKNDFNIKLVKRLDETYGRVKFGRMAASLRKVNTNWEKEKADKQLIAKVNQAVREQFKPLLEEQQQEVIPEPAISGDLDLELTGGIFRKKPLKEGVDFTGSAKVVDGIIEEINVSLPDGNEFSINTRERMVGNVFQYEDTQTRETKSGLFYRVKDGTYMLTLTDDTKFGGIRLQFSAPGDAEIKTDNSEQSWAMNNQNEKKDEQQAINKEDDYGYQYEGNDTYENEPDPYKVQTYNDVKETASPYSHSFGV